MKSSVKSSVLCGAVCTESGDKFMKSCLILDRDLHAFPLQLPVQHVTCSIEFFTLCNRMYFCEVRDGYLLNSLSKAVYPVRATTTDLRASISRQDIAFIPVGVVR